MALRRTGSNPRQIQAISDEIHQQLKKRGELPVSIEGYDNADWILMDYGDYLVHVFSQKAREYYEEMGTVPAIRKFAKYVGIDQKILFKQWMTGPMKPITKYGGLPKPTGCV